MSTTIKSHYGKQLIIGKYTPGTVVFAHGPDNNGKEWKHNQEAIFNTVDVLAALKDVGALPEGYTVTDLPEVKEDGNGYIEAGNTFRFVDGNLTSEKVLKGAKELLAIGLELQKREEAAKVKAAEEAARKQAEADALRAEQAELDTLRKSVIAEHYRAFGYVCPLSYPAMGIDERRVVDALVTAKQAELKHLRKTLAAV